MIKGPLIVTGCQRSGTALVTRALAHDLKLEVLGDRDFTPNITGIEKLYTLIENGITDIAIQMPTALNCFVDLHHSIPNAHFVGVIRATEDIIESMKRIKWQYDEYYHYIDFYYDHIKMMKGNWELLKNILPESCWTEVKYESFSKHPLYVKKDQRKDFTANQWSPGKPVGPQYYLKNKINV
jgi:hypothetical protein|tara:strand:+ start:179 stop:724 length:546 start_codon:yes stop_codon:yes gene_type:complete